MKWNNEFVNSFSGYDGAGCQADVWHGYRLILVLQKFRFYAQLLWEAISIVFIFLPASDLTKTMVMSVNSAWERLPEKDRGDVLSALYVLDAKSTITMTLGIDRHHKSRTPNASFYFFWILSYCMVVIPAAIVMAVVMFARLYWHVQ